MILNINNTSMLIASSPGFLTPALVLVLQATNAGVRRPGNEASILTHTGHSITHAVYVLYSQVCQNLKWPEVQCNM